MVEDKSSQQTYSDPLRSLIDRAVTDAEQIVASIKTKAQEEAQDEAASIIDQARQGADEIRGRAEIAALKEAEEVLSALISGKPAVTKAEAKQKAQLFLLRAREEIEQEIRRAYKQAHSRLLSSLLSTSQEAVRPLETSAATQIEVEPDIASKEKEAKLIAEEEAKIKAEEAREGKEDQKQAEKEAKLVAKEEAKRKAEEAREAKEDQKQAEKEAKLVAKETALEEEIEEPAQLDKEVTISEPAEEITEELPEQQIPEEKPGDGEPVSTPLKLDRQALYDGEVELAIAVPVNPVAVSKLYNYLQTTPETKILYTRGSWDRGTIITVTLDRPLPLIDMISKISGIQVASAAPQKDNLARGTSGSLLGISKKGVTRINISLKEK